MDLDALKKKFIGMYGEGGFSVYFAPGRVNLIGEHTDYNGGYVFPCALNFGTYAVARRRNDSAIKFASSNFELAVSIEDGSIKYLKEDDWANYPKGIVEELRERGFEIGGFEVLYGGDIPNGAGLSSSASIELVTAVMLKDLFGCGIGMMDLVRLSQKAENEFVGMKCGIMDQFAVGMGRRGRAVFLNCRTLEYRYVPLRLDGCKLVIANTNKRRSLADSKYNERRAECERAVRYLRNGLDISLLGDIDVSAFEKYKYLIKDGTAAKRAEHVVYEDERVLSAIDALSSGDIEGFGRLMDKSHESLRDLYEVTGFELDTLVEEAGKVPGTIGSRMTGAGFGGCTVSIVREGAVDEFIKSVGDNYKHKTGLAADFYLADTGDGAGRIE